MYTTAKRFPPSCRFYSQGNCRAGQDCHFAHILPLSKSPKNVLGDTAIENNKTTSSSSSIQKVIREIELNQLENKYSDYIKKKINVDIANSTLIELLLPLENQQDLNVLFIIPTNYPDTPCILRITTTKTTSEYKWPQVRYPTLVQQLDWFISHFNSL